ncbi:hypothetical protein PRIPAC_83222 [Pristionchus pacificus]|uniref:Uncharacterized protein n=1 Tax=Pristionchus pacificus TaxID=54126 RepID=A0A2A6CCJ1_PRIPA|nr:hypothetical protein PRIPAC_83222 [Pristionchus pacificus]|eukprot:PDM75808.1 hypothetical protein PRIPAC_40187 [Pristionchus pacificus]
MVRGDLNLIKFGETVLPRDILSLLNRDTTGDSLAIQEMAEYLSSIV